ncbi:hypothetical protein LSH36_143g06026, partial [Paralvinella palmiformis]
ALISERHKQNTSFQLTDKDELKHTLFQLLSHSVSTQKLLKEETVILQDSHLSGRNLSESARFLSTGKLANQLKSLLSSTVNSLLLSEEQRVLKV